VVVAAVAINLNINFHDTLMKSLPTKKMHVLGAALFAAAMTLPFSNAAFAEAAPEKGIVAFKYLNYHDSQPDEDRIGVNAYTVSAMAPIAGKWSISTSYTYDSVTGASPEHHSYISEDMLSGASPIREQRYAGDLSITRYLSKGSLTVGSSYSEENDYISRGYSAQGSISTEDKNTTFTVGGSYTTDSIDPSNDKDPDINALTGYEKRTVAGMLGVTQVLTKRDIVQLNLGYSKGRGYMSDPYKLYDDRPLKRESKTVMTRWNHHFDGIDGTSHLSYRYYTDSFGIKAHTFGLEYLQSLPNEWTVTPSVRFYSQTAADFYLPDLPPPGPSPDPPYSLDQRLSSYGALTLGIKVSKRIAKDWLVDFKYENYEQRAGWSMTGGGDTGLAPFSATFFQAGLSREF
jgi:hypothetical protein